MILALIALMVFHSTNASFDSDISNLLTCKGEMQNILLRRLNNVQLCADGWEYLNGKCYKLVVEEKNWEEARANCVNLGAKLAEPQDPCDSELLRHFSQISWPSEE